MLNKPEIERICSASVTKIVMKLELFRKVAKPKVPPILGLLLLSNSQDRDVRKTVLISLWMAVIEANKPGSADMRRSMLHTCREEVPAQDLEAALRKEMRPLAAAFQRKHNVTLRLQHQIQRKNALPGGDGEDGGGDAPAGASGAALRGSANEPGGGAAGGEGTAGGGGESGETADGAPDGEGGETSAAPPPAALAHAEEAAEHDESASMSSEELDNIDLDTAEISGNGVGIECLAALAREPSPGVQGQVSQFGVKYPS